MPNMPSFFPHSRRLRVVLLLLVHSVVLNAVLTGAEPPELAPWDGELFAAEAMDLLDAAQALPVEDDAHVQILLIDHRYRFEDDGRHTYDYRFVVRLLSQAGVEAWSTFSGTWSPWHQERPEMRARVITPDVVEHWLDPETIGETPVGDQRPDLLSDRIRLRAPLPAVRVGAVVEANVTTRETAPLFSAGTVHQNLFGFSIPIENIRLTIDAPKTLPLTFKTQLMDGVEPEHLEGVPEEGDGDRVRLRFIARDVEAYDDPEPMVPSDVHQKPLVTFSTAASWSDVARHYHEVVERQIGEPEVKKIVAKATKGAEGRREKAERLLAWLQSKIRYTGLEFGEGAIVPRRPEETLERHYGDCKDKATLLVALLRSAGIPAHLALLQAGSGLDVEPEVPGLGLFNHAIVVAPGDASGEGDAEDLWIDPTDEFAGVNDLPLSDQGRLALIARPETTGLVEIPTAPPSANRQVEVREIFLDPELGEGRVVETTHGWGSFGRSLRRGFNGQKPEETKEGLTAYVASDYGADELLDFEISDPTDLSRPIKVRVEADGVDSAVSDFQNAVVVFDDSELLLRLPDFLFQEDDEDGAEGDAMEEGSESLADGQGTGHDLTRGGRRSDMVLYEPYVFEYHYRITAPDGYRPVEVPASEERWFGPALLTREVRGEGTELHIDLRFDTMKRRFSPEELKAMKAEIQEIGREDRTVLIFEQIGEAHLAVGEIGPALAEFDRLIEQNPARALPRIRRARALLGGGLGDVAVAEAKAAVELEPENPLAYQTLAWVEQHDVFGRLRRGDFDRQAALAAYRKAKELEPENVLTRQNLAILLEFDDEGFRYSPEADLDAAIAEYEALVEDLDDHGLDDNLAIAYARNGSFDDMLDWIEVPEAVTSPAIRLVARAAADSPATAIRKSREEISSPEALQQTFATAGQTLMQWRRYPEAAALFKAAAAGSPNPTVALSLADTLAKTRRFEELELDDGPLGVVKRFIIAVFEGSRGVEALRDEILSVRVPKDDAGFAEIEAALHQVRQAFRPGNFALGGLADLALASLRTTVEGDDEAGFRVDGRYSFAGSNEQSVFYISRDADSSQRLRASEDMPTALGEEALHLLAAGKPEAARLWLDWALRSVVAPPADDPYAGSGFFHFWNHDSEGDPETMRLAAASLMSGGERSEEALPILETGLAGVDDKTERTRYEIALATAYQALERFDDLLALTQGWLEKMPSSEAAFLGVGLALEGLDRFEELEALVRDRLELRPDDVPALGLSAGLAMRRDDFDAAEAAHRRLVDLGHGEMAYNNLAWMRLLHGVDLEQALEEAQQDVLLSNGTSWPALHTLASVYAELDRPTEARQILLQAMEARGLEEPETVDWFIWGRIAESYGELDAARAAYTRVEPPEDEAEWNTSTYRLVERRLEILNGNDTPNGG